jgi:hypothetical protein
VTPGGLDRRFSPRGQDLAFLLSCIGLVRPSSSADLKQNKTKDLAPAFREAGKAALCRARWTSSTGGEREQQRRCLSRWKDARLDRILASGPTSEAGRWNRVLVS